jgi:hypothetical protein
MTESEWLEITADMEDIWPRHPLPERTIEAWYKLLAPLPASVVAAAVHELALAGREFPPPVGQIYQTATRADQLREPFDALAELEQACRKIGAYQPAPNFDDPVLAELVTRWCWERLCHSDMRDGMFRAQWRDEYTACARRHVDDRRRALAAGTVNRPAVDGNPLAALGIGKPNDR